MNFRRIRAIIHKDFIEALRNKTILIAIFLPLAASLSLAVIDSAQRPQFFQIGITGEASYPMGIFLMASAGDNLHITPYDGVAEGTEAVKQGKADALILAESEGQFRVYADGTNPLAYLSLKELLETLLSAYVGRPSEPVLELVLVNEGQASTSVLPLWLTITTVMIGVMILSGSFSEEKEKGTLDNIRISPTADGVIMISKGISSLVYYWSPFPCFLTGLFPRKGNAS